MQRRDFLAGIGLLAALGPQATRAAVKDPLPAKGVRLTYEVLYGSTRIGTQTVHIRDHDKKGHVVVEHDSKLEVRVLFAVAYKLEHRATEVWEGFTLSEIRSETVENGVKTLIEGRAAPEGFRIRNAGKEWVAPGDTVTSDSFWIAAAMKSASVVNTRTGDTAAPQVSRLSDGRWHLKANFSHGPVEARVRFDGDFMAEAEVDSDGHTVTLRRIATT